MSPQLRLFAIAAVILGLEYCEGSYPGNEAIEGVRRSGTDGADALGTHVEAAVGDRGLLQFGSIVMEQSPPPPKSCLDEAWVACNYQGMTPNDVMVNGGENYFCEEQCMERSIECPEQLAGPVLSNAWILCEVRNMANINAEVPGCVEQALHSCGLAGLWKPTKQWDEAAGCGQNCTKWASQCPEFDRIWTVLKNNCALANTHGCYPAELINCGYHNGMVVAPQKVCLPECRDKIVFCDYAAYLAGQVSSNKRALGEEQLAMYNKYTMQFGDGLSNSDFDFTSFYDNTCKIVSCNISKCMVEDWLQTGQMDAWADNAEQEASEAMEEAAEAMEEAVAMTPAQYQAWVEDAWDRSMEAMAVAWEMWRDPEAQKEAEAQASRALQAAMLKLCSDSCQKELSTDSCEAYNSQFKNQFIWMGTSMRGFCDQAGIDLDDATTGALIDDILQDMATSPLAAPTLPPPAPTQPPPSSVPVIDPTTPTREPTAAGPGAGSPTASRSGSPTAAPAQPAPSTPGPGGAAEPTAAPPTEAPAAPTRAPAPTTAAPTAVMLNSLAQRLLSQHLDPSAEPLSRQQMEYLAGEMGVDVSEIGDMGVNVSPATESESDDDSDSDFADLRMQLRREAAKAAGSDASSRLRGCLLSLELCLVLVAIAWWR